MYVGEPSFLNSARNLKAIENANIDSKIRKSILVNPGSLSTL
jgi:hypothetical protein